MLGVVSDFVNAAKEFVFHLWHQFKQSWDDWSHDWKQSLRYLLLDLIDKMGPIFLTKMGTSIVSRTMVRLGQHIIHYITSPDFW